MPPGQQPQHPYPQQRKGQQQRHQQNVNEFELSTELLDVLVKAVTYFP
jgi:hypothetical protein